MELRGRIARLLPMSSGVSKEGKEWKRQDFIFEFFETEDQRWSDKVLLSIMNDRIDEYKLQEGEEVSIGFGHNVREYNGRVYNEMRVYKLTKIGGQPAQPQEPAPQAPKTTKPEPKPEKNEEDDGLPF